MAAIGTKQVTAFLHLCTHPFHMLGVHGIVARTDSERGHCYFRKIGFAVPLSETSAYTKFRRSLHQHIDIVVGMFETTIQRLGPFGKPADMFGVELTE